jgi:hypothetical protein
MVLPSMDRPTLNRVVFGTYLQLLDVGKNWSGTNTLAYFEESSVTKKRVLVRRHWAKCYKTFY